MRRKQDGTAGRLVHAARLHADKAVLHQIEPADAVFPPTSLSRVSNAAGDSASPLTETGSPLLEADGDDLGRVRSLLGVDGALVDVVGRDLGGILEHPCLPRRCAAGWHRPKGGFAAFVLGDGDLVEFGVFDQLRAALQVPFAPGRDHPDRRVEGIGGELEPHLIVALAGGAVGNRVSPALPGDFDQTLGDQGTGDGGAEQVLALVNRVGAEHRKHEIAHELLAQILDVDVSYAHHLGLATSRLQFLALPQIGGEGDHLAAVGALEPFEDDGGIEPARIGEHHFL